MKLTEKVKRIEKKQTQLTRMFLLGIVALIGIKFFHQSSH